jgi:hypothetical protein
MSLRLFAAALAAALLATAPAGRAADGWAGCYARSYDAAHLKRHPGQRVRAIAVLLTTAEEPNTAYAAVVTAAVITAKATTGNLTYSHDAQCLRAQAALECWVTPYRGYVVLTRTPDGLRLENPLGFRLDAGDTDAQLAVAADADHRVFALPKAGAEACR